MSREQDFLRLIFAAIDACEMVRVDAMSKGKNWMAEDADVAKEQFRKIARQAESNTLSPSSGGGLGITRALSEWAPGHLYAAGEAVEDYYMRNW